MKQHIQRLASVVVPVIAIVTASATLGAQATATTFKATATVKSPGKNASVPVTIKIDKYVTDADRDKVVAAVKGGTAQKALAAMPDIGTITVGAKATPIKYAYTRSTGSGRLVTVVTAQPIYFVGGAEEGAKSKAGYDLGLALLVLDAQDTGDGELAPAVKLKVDANGAIVTDDYGTEVVRLTKAAKAQ